VQSHYGFELEIIPVDQHGQVNPKVVAQMLRKETAIVSVIYANNEIGTINPISEIGAVCRQKRILFHSDAVQAAAYLSVDVNTDNVDMLSIGAHKFYGPKGVGALFVREGTSIIPTQTGGGQERSMRPGTHNLPLIIGMAEALKITQLERKEWMERLSGMRNRIIHDVLNNIPQARLTGHPDQRLPNHASFAFDRVDGNTLIMLLDVAGFACSSGSACKSGTPKPSSVLKALGLSDNWTTGALRVTLGRHTTNENITAFLKALPDLVDRAKLIV
jgi:cysteine desulfurase